MAGLRNQKKNEARSKILSAAHELLMEKGYDVTTTDEVADRAGIAAGTLYNYFKSKAELFTEVFIDEYREEHDWTIDKKLLMSNKTPAELVMGFVSRMMKKACFMPKPLLRDMMTVGMSFAKTQPNLFKKLIALDIRMLDSLTASLDILKTIGKLKTKHDSRQLVELIYGAITYESVMWLFMPDRSYEAMEEQIRLKLEILLGE